MIKLYSGSVNVTYSYNSTEQIYTPTAWDMAFLCVLPDAISCEVREEKNGAYEVSMTYVSTGTNADKIATDCILGVSCPLRDSVGENYFRIYRVEKDLSGHVQISARHVSNDLIYNGVTHGGLSEVSPVSGGILTFAGADVSHAYSAWLRHAANAKIPFTFGGDAEYDTTVTGVGFQMDFCTATSVRAYLGGEELQGYDLTARQAFPGCAYVWDKWDISLWEARGQERNQQITYGTNLADLLADDDTDGVYTYVCGFYLQSDGMEFKKYVGTLYQTSYSGLFAVPRIKMLDCSAEVVNQYPQGATTSQITALLNKMAQAEQKRMNAAGVPIRSITVDVVEASISNVFLCDTLPVLYKRNGIEINTSMEIVSYVWDVIMQRYTEITLGAIQMDLAKEIAKQKPVSISGLQTNVATIQNEVKEARTDLDKAIIQYVSGAADLNNYRTEGKYFFSGGDGMLTNQPNGAINGWLEVFVDQYNPHRGVKQIWHRYGSNPATFMDEYIRLYASGTWGSWERLAGIDSSETSTSGRYTRYMKFSDGSMICMVSVNYTGAIASQSGSMYYGSQISLGNWPVAFTGTPYITTGLRGANDSFVANITDVSKTSAGKTYLWSNRSRTSSTYGIDIVGYGRWR